MDRVDVIEYTIRSYDSKVRRYNVLQTRNNVPMYWYKGKLIGNTMILYPYKPSLATDVRTKPIEMSIFDIKRKEA